MKLLVTFIVLALSSARASNASSKCVIVRNANHKKQIIVDNKDSPYQLAIDYGTNTLFFSYYNNKNGEVFSSAFVNLTTNEHRTIPGITKGFASTVDNKNNIVYLGGVDGLYKFDYQTKTAKHINGTEHSIWQMFFKNQVYYTTYPKEQVYIFKNGKTEMVPELADTRAMLVALNNDLDFIFRNSTGIFKLNKNNSESILLGDYNANAMTADINGKVYFSTPDGIYFINEDGKIDEIASLTNVYGVVIEKDGNIIYATENEIVRLKASNSPCFD